MHEEMIYDALMQRMLGRVPEDLDKREGSVIWDALGPAASELELLYLALGEAMDETFADKASREYLIRRCAERGIAPNPATAAVLEAEALPDGVDIGGQHFTLNRHRYVAEERTEAGLWRMRCETPGEEGGEYLGDMVPVSYIDTLESVRALRVLIPGKDEEGTEALRARYFASFDAKGYGGNIQDYIDKTNALPGVGATRVLPVWAGGGTVKVVIIDSAYNRASAALVGSVQQAIDPTGDGQGLGIAPIGHIVTVDTAQEYAVSMETTLTYDAGHSWESTGVQITAAMEQYLLALRREWAGQESLVVRIAQIETRVLAVEGILDIAQTRLNGAEENYIVPALGIPILGGITA